MVWPLRFLAGLVTALLLSLATLWLAPSAMAGPNPPVVDEALLLDPATRAELTSRIEALQDRYGIDILIHTALDYNGTSIEAANEAYYREGGYGQGQYSSGISYFLVMGTRGTDFFSLGYGHTVFNRYAREYISDKIRPDFSAGEYAAGFRSLLNYVEDFLAEAEQGTPYDDNHPYVSSTTSALVVGGGAAGSAGVAGAVIAGMRRKMNTARPRPAAAEYSVGGLQLTRASETFIGTHTAVIPRPKQSESSSSSGGFSSHDFGGSGGGSGHTSGHF